jgi:hypothetical protein
VELTHRTPLNAFIKERTFCIMVNWKVDSVKVRKGQAKCPVCGEMYDPTYGPCPCQRRFYVAIFAAIVVLFLLAWPAVTGAQSPEPTPECFMVDGQWLCISHVEMTPFVPTSTPIPPPTMVPTVTPTATVVIAPVRNFVYLSLITTSPEER